MKNTIIKLLASGFFISHIPAAVTGYKKFTGSGFVGTLLALALVPLLPAGRIQYAVFLFLFISFSIWIADKAEIIYNKKDDPRIVIDEIDGYWLALAFTGRSPAELLTAFVLFRFFDTLKPWPIRYFDRRWHGGPGVVADDLIGGLFAGVLTRFIFFFIK